MSVGEGSNDEMPPDSTQNLNGPPIRIVGVPSRYHGGYLLDV